MPERKTKIMIQCENCWKTIEMKVNRKLCIKCSNKRNHILDAERRKAKQGLVG